MNLRRTAAPSPVMTLKELAEYLKVHPTMIYKLIHRHELPCFKVGADYRFNRENINKWIAE